MKPEIINTQWLHQKAFFPIPDSSPAPATTETTTVIIRRKTIQTRSHPAPAFLPPYISRVFWADPPPSESQAPGAAAAVALLDTHGSVAVSVRTATTIHPSCPVLPSWSKWLWTAPAAAAAAAVDVDEEAARNRAQTLKIALALQGRDGKGESSRHDREKKDHKAVVTQEQRKGVVMSWDDWEMAFWPHFHAC